MFRDLAEYVYIVEMRSGERREAIWPEYAYMYH